jgi:3-methyladenine DNA glycosylase AlkD
MDAASVVEWLKGHATTSTLEGMARYGLPSEHALGVAMRDIQALAKLLGKNHDLALDLWTTGIYEARLLASYVDDPARVTPEQMDQWCRDFDNWGVCDTVCFALLDRTPHAWGKVTQWAHEDQEFVKRAAFALLWGLTVHDKKATNEPFLRGLELVERAAGDERNFVKKAVSMALRAPGKRNPDLRVAALAAAERLCASPSAAARWIGKDALRELSAPASMRRAGKTAGS